MIIYCYKCVIIIILYNIEKFIYEQIFKPKQKFYEEKNFESAFYSWSLQRLFRLILKLRLILH